ncbi:protein FAM149B1-like isoform X2 [Centruroides sculpturatus]|uniref:protein FAM149B1-like isoform X2 n=1 Tax=Centruroides sculpturatus TaxID=218467 RepID=UPI000C6E1571|nr:protein FAM149B1-like isoform X2 [Centruroides sculpturatus]
MMTGRYRRSVLNLQGIQQSVIDNHPLPEIIDGTPKIEDLKLDDDYNYSRFDSDAIQYSTKLEDRNETYALSSDFTNGTRCTESVDSWCDDEFERECTKKVEEMLEFINGIMYDDKPFEDINLELKNECKLWIEKFPHFRITGKQIVQVEDNSIQFHAFSYPSSSPVQSEVTFDPYFNFQVKGKQLPILPSEKETATLIENDLINNENTNIPTFVEETIAQHGEYEELFACHKIVHTSSRESSSLDNSALHHLNIDFVRECVLDKIMEKLWPELLLVSHIIQEEQHDKEEMSKKVLPSLPSTIPHLRKSQWDPEKVGNPLDGILTVSSKVLQKRDQRLSVESNIVTRPGSSLISPNRFTSLNSLIPTIQEVPLIKTTTHHSNFNFPSVPNSRTSSALQQFRKFSIKDSEWPKVLQEETENLPSVTHTSMINVQRQISEPFDEKSETKFPSTHFSLPPIINNNIIISKQNVKSPLFQSMIESPSEKFSKQLSKNEKVDSRPSTCKSNKSIREKKSRNKVNSNNQQTYNPFDVPILGGLSEKLLSPYQFKDSEAHLPSLEPNLNTDQLVTLFPVVKSLELQRQEDNKRVIKRNQSAKKYNVLNRIKR